MTGSNDAEEQEILSSVGAVSGLSGEGEDRRDTIRRQEERRAETTERRRGYAVGAAWDEGNMIQAMARLKNPTIAWSNKAQLPVNKYYYYSRGQRKRTVMVTTGARQGARVLCVCV